jgi:hypothetical protein
LAPDAPRNAPHLFWYVLDFLKKIYLGEHGVLHGEHGEDFAFTSLFVIYIKLISYIFSYVKYGLNWFKNIIFTIDYNRKIDNNKIRYKYE